MVASDDLFGRSRPSPEVYRHRVQLLHKLADNVRSPILAEMAKGLLSGHLTSRDVMQSDAYGHALGEHTRAFTTWYSGLTEVEKDAIADNAKDALNRAADQGEASTAARRRPVRRSADTEEEPPYDETDWTTA